MSWRFHIVDVFTSSAFAGNALAVLPDARGLTTAQVQAIAREFNLSETTFVFPDETSPARFRVRIFCLAPRLTSPVTRPSARHARSSPSRQRASAVRQLRLLERRR
jgi:PhzF family phenazine biosynthesis protein